MSFVKQFIEAETVSRRNLLIAGALGVGGVLATRVPAYAADAVYTDPTLAWSYRDRTNPYWNSIVSGGEAYVESLGKKKSDLVNLINGGSSEKSLADVKAIVAKTGGNLALAIDPNDSPNCRPVVESCQAGKAYVFTIWNKTDDLHPWDVGDYWVGHLSWSDLEPAEKTARILCDAMGGKGAIVGLGGIASNVPAIERKQGLMNGLKAFPNVKLLDYQPADWDTTKANQIMSDFMTAYGDKITGVFCANDTIAYGVIEALRAEGLAGKIPVVGYDGGAQAINYIASGDMLATVSTDPFWAGGIALSLAHAAAVGKYKPGEESHAHREFYGPTIIVTKKDVESFKKEYIDANPKYDWSDYFSLSSGEIKYNRY